MAQVLQALEVPEGLQRQCFQALGTPQAERYLAQNTTESQALPVSGGELLRALRVRRGLSQADAARAIGVTQALLSRWENNDCWPENTRLLALCQVLQATPGETHGLATRGWQNHQELPRDREALIAVLRQLANASHHFEHDLFYLALGSRFWELYKNNRIERAEALRPWGYFGSYLAWHGRMREAIQVSAPTFEEMKRSARSLDNGQFFALSATTLALSSLGDAQSAAETFLEFDDRIGPNLRSSLYEDLADIAWKANQLERCDHYWRRSIETAYSEFNQAYCRLRFAEKLCLSSRPREALAQVEQAKIDRNNHHSLIQIDLVAGGALALLREHNVAEPLLSRGRRQLQETPYPGLSDFDRQLQPLILSG